MLRTLTASYGRLSSTRVIRRQVELNLLARRANNTAGDDPSVWIEDNLRLKVEDRSKNETYVEAVPVPTGRESRLIKVQNENNKEACVLCRLDLQNLSYTDVMILSQFIKKNGSLVTFHESKLCSKQYNLIRDLIKKAQRCNLIKRPFDYLVPGAWHDMNTYIERDRQRDQPMKVIKKEYWKI